MRILRIYKELRNYFFLKKVIRLNYNSADWNKQKLHKGWFGVIYTVINLPPEVIESEEQYYQVYAVEQLMPINEYFTSLNINEIVTPRVKNLVDKEKGIYAYGIKFMPLFRDLTAWWVISRLGSIGLLVWLQYKYNIFNLAMEWIHKLF